MKRIIYLFAFMLIINLGYAQTGFRQVGIGAEIALPLGDFGDAYSIGFGASGKAFYALSEKGDITATLGYIHFGIKESNEYMSGHMSMIPIMFGYRHNFGGFYGEPQIGLMMLKSTVEMDFGGLSGIFDDFSGSASETKVSFGLGGGYEFGVWDLGARFQIIDNMNFFGIRLGYNFSL